MTAADRGRFRALRRLLNARPDPTHAPTLGCEYAEQARTAYLARFAPDVETATDQLRLIVDDLAAANALDEGTGTIFDDMIDAWAKQWHAQIDAESSARRSLLELAEAEARAQLELQRARVEWAEAQMAEADRQLAEFGRRWPDRAGGAAPLLHLFRQRRPSTEFPTND